MCIRELWCDRRIACRPIVFSSPLPDLARIDTIMLDMDDVACLTPLGTVHHPMEWLITTLTGMQSGSLHH